MRWAAKILAKVVLSRLPVPYARWSRLGMFRHGSMDDAGYALGVFHQHASRAFPLGVPKDLVMLELGPGDSVASALIGYAHGARTYLVDIAPFADRRVETYKAIAAHLASQGLAVPSLDRARTLDDVLKACRAEYLTDGVESLRQLADGSVDLVWSHAVLANVRKADLETLIGQTRRILKPGGLASHHIDFRDQLDRGLSALRLPEGLWEWDFLARSGFYTNRVRAVTMGRLFRAAGFEVEKEELDRWPSLPIARRSLNAEFQAYTDAELLVTRSRILLRAAASPASGKGQEGIPSAASRG
jgi:SAM-dependent methyltransferase